MLLFLLLQTEVDIPALSVESLLHLDLGSQGCPGPACYHLNHPLISPSCTLCCWINNTISVKQTLLASWSLFSIHWSLSGFLPASLLYLQTGKYAIQTLVFVTCEDILWIYIHCLEAYPNPWGFRDLPLRWLRQLLCPGFLSFCSHNMTEQLYFFPLQWLLHVNILVPTMQKETVHTAITEIKKSSPPSF